MQVFAQPNLVPYLCEIESNVELANTNALHSCNSNYQSIVPPLAPTTMWSLNTTRDSNTSYNPSSVWNAKPELLVTFGVPGDKWGVLIKQKILEYEGPNFVYKPTFTSNIAPEVNERTYILTITVNISNISCSFMNLFCILRNPKRSPMLTYNIGWTN